MGKFDGHKLLMLGSNAGSVDIVRYAKKHGAYTIVTDWFPPEKSPAKFIADEHCLCSTGDTESLLRIIKEKEVTAVFAGISEFNLLQAMTLCEKCGFPFYCTKKQWNLIENKKEFRKLCIQYNVPCPKTYYIGEGEVDYNEIFYPVIVKPVDSSSSLGITICNSQIDLQKAIPVALHVSNCKNIIIEDYVNGEEFSAHYTIVNGQISLSCVDNRYPVALNKGNVTTIPIARVYPSRFLQSYKKSVNHLMIKLIKSLKLSTGVFFLQGLYNSYLDKFYIFEAGLRSAAEAPYRFIDRINGINYMHNLVDYAMLGTCNCELGKEDPSLKGKVCGVISFASKGGIVGKIEGVENMLKEIPNIIDFENRYPVGTSVPFGNTLRQILLRFVVIANNMDEFKADIAKINKRVNVYNNEGEDMAIKFNINLL